MSSSPTSPALQRERAVIEAELETLGRRDAELRSALDDVEHDMRRCNDALERIGWSSREEEARRDLLRDNRAVIAREREMIGERRAQLVKRLSAIEQRLDEEIRDD